jgi:hypothetical protein
MMHIVVIFGLSLSGVSFILFIVSLVIHLFGPRSRKGGGAGDTEQQGAGEFAKLFEAFAKLADSLNHSSPVVLSLMASIIFFALALLAESLDSARPKEGNSGEEKKATVSMATLVCVFSPFDTGKHELSRAVVKQLTLDPDHCEKHLLDRIASGTTSILLFVGHADRRNLKGPQFRDYGSNEALAYQRALQIKKALLSKYKPTAAQPLSPDELARQMIIVEGGPANTDPKTKEPELAQDRSVEVFSFGLATGNTGKD